MWKWLGNDHLSIGRQKRRFKRFKHSKLFVHALYDVKDNYWLIYVHRSCKHTMRARKPKRYGSRNIGICQFLWVDKLYMTCLCQIVYKHWTNTFIKILIYKANAVYGLKYDFMDFRYGIL